VIVIDVATLEQPIGDSYLDSDLWSSVDEQPIALDRKAGLDDNGFRVGVIGGMPAPRLQELLTAERWCQAHRITTRAGQSKSVPMGPAQGDVEFTVRIDGADKPQKFIESQFGFNLVPHRTGDGRVRLTVTPQVTHGGRSLWLQPAEGNNWSINGQRPVEQWPALSFDVTISPQEYFLVGTRYDRSGTLGHLTFVASQGVRPAQRLLVIRARPQSEAAKHSWQYDHAAPLAYQASRAARGTSD
jgi:hypothetical protein